MRDANLPEAEAQKGDGERRGGGRAEEEADVHEEDPNAGQYVNYQVGFEYTRTANTKRKGWGLHVLVGREGLV
jgi:hypothetical protein